MKVTRTLVQYIYTIRIYFNGKLTDLTLESFQDLSEKKLDKLMLEHYETHLLSVVEKKERKYKCTLDVKRFFEISKHEEI